MELQDDVGALSQSHVAVGAHKLSVLRGTFLRDLTLTFTCGDNGRVSLTSLRRRVVCSYFLCITIHYRSRTSRSAMATPTKPIRAYKSQRMRYYARNHFITLAAQEYHTDST
jgi:hypothetical protein